MMPSGARVFLSQRAGLLVPSAEAEGAAYQQRRDGSPRVSDHRWVTWVYVMASRGSPCTAWPRAVMLGALIRR
jgi:hypothetical protein